MGSKLFRKLTSLALAVLLVLGMMPAMGARVFAADAADLLTIQVGEEIQAYSMAEDASGEGWSYDAATTTLTLSNFTGHYIDSSTTDTLTIVLDGTNTLTAADVDQDALIQTNGNLIIHVATGTEVDSLVLDGTGAKGITGIVLGHQYYTADDKVMHVYGGTFRISNVREGILTSGLNLYNDCTMDVEATLNAANIRYSRSDFNTSGDLSFRAGSGNALTNGVVKSGSGSLYAASEEGRAYALSGTVTSMKVAADNTGTVTLVSKPSTFSDPSSGVPILLESGQIITTPENLFSWTSNGYVYYSVYDGEARQYYVPEIMVIQPGEEQVDPLTAIDTTAEEYLAMYTITLEDQKALAASKTAPLFQTAVSGGSGNYDFQLDESSPALPKGLSMMTGSNPSISGTVNLSADYPASEIVIRVTDLETAESVTFLIHMAAIAKYVPPTDLIIDSESYAIDSDQSGEGWSYASSTNTLTLTHFSGHFIEAQSDKALTIVLSGTNTLTPADTSQRSLIHTAGNLTIRAAAGTASDSLVLDGTGGSFLVGIKQGENSYTADNKTMMVESGAIQISNLQTGINTAALTLSGDSTLDVQATFRALNLRYSTSNFLTSGDVVLRSGSGSCLTNKVIKSGSGNVTATSESGKAYENEGVTTPCFTVASGNTGTITLNSGLADPIGAQSGLRLKLENGQKIVTPEEFFSYTISDFEAISIYDAEAGGYFFPAQVVIQPGESGEDEKPLSIIDTTAEPYASQYTVTFRDGESIDSSRTSGLFQNVVTGGSGNYSYELDGSSPALPKGVYLRTSGGAPCLLGTVNLTETYPASDIIIRITDQETQETGTFQIHLTEILPKGATVTGVVLTGEAIEEDEEGNRFVRLSSGSTIKLTAEVQPSNASNKSVSWSSSDTGIFIVGSGTITGVSVGKATVTVTTRQGGYRDSLAVYIGERKPSVALSAGWTSLTGLEAGAAYRLGTDALGYVTETADETGSIPLRAIWSERTIEVIKVGAEPLLDSQPTMVSIPDIIKDLNPVTNVNVQNEATGAMVSWTKAKNATAYTILYREAGTEDYQIALNNVTESFGIVPADLLTSGTLYEFAVQANAAGYESSLSGPVELCYLETPVISAVTNVSAGTKITWSEVAGAESYVVVGYDIEADEEFGYEEIGSTSFTVPKADLDSGKQYAYSVLAVNEEGESDYAEDWVYTYMAAPTITKTRNVNAGIEVTWEAVDGADSYTVMYKENGGSWKPYKEGVTATKFVVPKKDLASGTKYWFTIKSVAEDGTTSGYTSGKAQTYMTTPAVTKTRNVNAGIEVTWGSVTGATSYVLMYKVDGGSWKTYKSGITTTKYVVPKADLKSGTKYWFTVKAKGAATSGYSSGKAQTYMTTPVVKSATKTSSGVKVTWGSVTGATSYTVMMKVSGGSWTTVKSGVTGTSYTVPKSKLTSGKTYSFTVKAKGAATSGYSSGKSLTYKA